MKDPRLSTARKIADARGITLDTLVKEIDARSIVQVDPELSAKISTGVKFRNSVKRLIEQGVDDGD